MIAFRLFIVTTVWLYWSGISAQPVGNDVGGVTLKFMTYNVKFASKTFEPLWEDRRDMQVELIRQYDPDILGTQEALKVQLDYLAKMLPEYIVVGEGRKGGHDDEHMAIFIKKDRFRLRELQSFQLSKTPEMIGSGPAINPRMVTWVRVALIDPVTENQPGLYPSDYRGHWENTRELYVFNTHLFNGNQERARLNGARLLREKIEDLQPFGHWEDSRPIVLMGDFNCLQGSIPHQVLVGDDTEPGLMKETIEQGKDIDWILYNGNVKVIRYEEVDFNRGGVYPSDHKPIYVELKMFTKSN